MAKGKKKHSLACARMNPVFLRSATCTVKRPAASRSTHYRRKSALASGNELLVARAFKQLRRLRPHNASIGRRLVTKHLAGALSAGVVGRLLRSKTFPGQLRQLSPAAQRHKEIVLETKKGKTTKEWNDLSQNSNSRLSRKGSYC